MDDVPESYTLPRITMTPTDDGKVRLEMEGGAYTFRVREVSRVFLIQLGLGVPEWLLPHHDPEEG